MSHNVRLAVAALAISLAAPALAAPPQDCTVCRDPLWPSLENLMPGIALDQPAAPAGPTGILTNTTRETVASRSNGVGVAATAASSTEVYSDPLWPQVKTVPAGMSASVPAAPVPVAKPARAASAPLASR